MPPRPLSTLEEIKIESATTDSPSTDQEGVEPRDNDVLCGRGGNINTHPGNSRFRDLVEQRKISYIDAQFKRDKRRISQSILDDIKGLTPAGRFLTRHEKDGPWREIDEDKARDKTSQALRENAPKIRDQIKRERDSFTAQQKQYNSSPHSVHDPYYDERHHSYHHHHHRQNDYPHARNGSYSSPDPYNGARSDNYNNNGGPFSPRIRNESAHQHRQQYDQRHDQYGNKYANAPYESNTFGVSCPHQSNHDGHSHLQDQGRYPSPQPYRHTHNSSHNGNNWEPTPAFGNTQDSYQDPTPPHSNCIQKNSRQQYSHGNNNSPPNHIQESPPRAFEATYTNRSPQEIGYDPNAYKHSPPREGQDNTSYQDVVSLVGSLVSMEDETDERSSFEVRTPPPDMDWTTQGCSSQFHDIFARTFCVSGDFTQQVFSPVHSIDMDDDTDHDYVASPCTSIKSLNGATLMDVFEGGTRNVKESMAAIGDSLFNSMNMNTKLS